MFNVGTLAMLRGVIPATLPTASADPSKDARVVQTLKTGAIVVLLMTVVFSTYTSLTKPPEPLPDDVVDALRFSDGDLFADGDFDAGMPESLASIGSGDPAASANGTPTDSASVSFDQTPLNSGGLDTGLASLGVPQIGQAGAMPTTPAGDVNVQFSDGVPAQMASASIPASAMLSDAGTDGQIAIGDASAVDPTRQVEQNLGTGRYPNTGATFRLPKPDGIPSPVNPDVDSEFNPMVGSDDIASRRLQMGVSNAIRNADKQFAEGRRRDALATLSVFYGTPDLTDSQTEALISRLDELARMVIYSRDHLLMSPHRVTAGETLSDIAEKYALPWELLANINDVRTPDVLLPGSELKVMQGPFRAVLDLSASELTLFVDDLYAGRFPVAVGNAPAPGVGSYTVTEKRRGKTFYDATGAARPVGSPENPYGDVWIDLGGGLSLHGSPSPTQPTPNGCVSLSGDNAGDLIGMLSVGSTVDIQP